MAQEFDFGQRKLALMKAKKEEKKAEALRRANRRRRNRRDKSAVAVNNTAEDQDGLDENGNQIPLLVRRRSSRSVYGVIIKWSSIG
jgi:hypothetical protein